ncbi:RNA-binding protein [Candidatus Woesearchaeota archaeon]|nr:MAG: RNA-binding protein [Candidatus Woesearchaeota archaeon]
MAECITCKTQATGQRGIAKFDCPACLKHQIIRCARCREIAAKYTCPACGFEGPN